jgi:hypothetical protein
VLTLAIVAGLLGACTRGRYESSGCSGSGGPAGSASPDPAAIDPPSVVNEALWVVDGSGRVRAFDGRTNRVTATVDLGPSTPDIPAALMNGGGLIWAYRFDTGMVALIDPATASITKRATVPPVRPLVGNRLRHAHGALWIAQPGRLWRISPAGEVTSTNLPASFAPSTMVATTRWLWFADGIRLVRVDPTAPASTRETVLPRGVRQLLSNAAGLYAIGTNTSEIRELDPQTGTVLSSVQLPGQELVMSMVDARTQVWATGNCGDVLHVSGGSHPRLSRTKISDVSQDLPAAASQDSLWVGDEVRSEIVRVSLRSGQILARIPFAAADTDDPAFSIVAGTASVWVVDGNFADGVSRVDQTANHVTRLTPAAHGTSGLSAVVSTPPQTVDS